MLEPFTKVTRICETSSTTVLLLDKTYILKLLPPVHDVCETVAIMKLAGTVIPVPQVYSFGYSGNCSFILMQYVKGHSLDKYIRYNGRHLSTLPGVLEAVDHIVHSLAKLGISHNDLYPRNIIVDQHLRVLSVIDWDVAGPWYRCQEYLRRVRFGTVDAEDFLEEEPWLHDWDHVFRRYCPDMSECLDHQAEIPDFPRYVTRCKDPWTGFWRIDHWPSIPQCIVPQRGLPFHLMRILPGSRIHCVAGANHECYLCNRVAHGHCNMPSCL